MVAAQAPRLLEQAAATDARLAAAPERLKPALLETREQQAQAELELRERRPELVPVPAARPVEPERTLSETYADYRSPERERGYSRGFRPQVARR